MTMRLSLLFLLLTAPGAAAAQAAKSAQPRPLPVLRGSVQDTLGQPLEGAQVEILGEKETTTTGVNGDYRVEGIKPGKYWVVVRRIGYAPLRAALSFNRGDDRRIVFQLEPMAQNLPDVVVRAEDGRWMRRYQDFVWRSKSSFGRFLTRDDIERAHANYLSDVVRRYLPWTTSDAFFTPYFPDPSGLMARLDGSGATRSGSLIAARNGRNCSPAVSVNGARPVGGWAVNDFRPEDVEAIEVYRRSFDMPLEFSGWDGGCGGLVVVWLR